VRVDEAKTQVRIREQALQGFFGAQRPLERQTVQPRDDIRGEENLQSRLLGEIVERVRERFGGNIQGIGSPGLGVLRSRRRR
jgi:hypothetical protein